MHSEHLPHSAEHDLSVVKDVALDVLGEAPLFAPDSPIVEYVSSRVAVLCGDEYPMPRVFVRDTNEVNACAMPGYVVVDRGLIDLIEFEEELDAGLGHEMIHIIEDHAHKPSRGGLLESIGNQRAHETEADVRDMMLLDRRGINPRGMISLFNKMASLDGGRRPHLTSSPTHGQSTERGVNVDQGFLLYDARSLTHAPLTPIPQEHKANLGRTITEPLDPSIVDDAIYSQAAMARQFRRFDSTNEEIAPLLSTQATLLEQHTGVPNDEAERLARVAAIKFRPSLAPHLTTGLTDPDAIRGLLADTSHDAVQQQCGRFNPQNYGRIASTIAREVIQETDLDVRAVSAIANVLRENTSDYFITAPLREYIRDHTNRETVDKVAMLIAPTNIPSTLLAGEFYEQPLMFRFGRKVSEKRLEEFRTISEQGTFIDALRYISRIRDEAGPDPTEIDESSDDIESILRSPYEYFGYEAYGWESMIDAAHDDQRGQSPQQRRSDSSVWNYIANHMDGLRPTQFVNELQAAGMSRREQREIVECILDAYDSSAPAGTGNAIEQLALVPLQILSGDTGRLKQALENSIQQLCGRPEVPAHRAQEHQPPLKAHSNATSWQTAIEMPLTGLADKTPYRQAMDEVIRGSEIIRDYLLLGALEQFDKSNDPAILHQLMLQHPLTRLRAGGAFVSEEILEKVRGHWEAGTARLLEQPDLLENEQHLLSLVALGMCAENVEVALSVPGEAMRRLVQLRSFDEGLDLVFNQFSHLPAYVTRAAVEELIEQKARTLADFEKLDKHMMSYLQTYIDEEQATIGLGSVIETNIIDAYKTHRRWEREVGTKHDTITGLESVRLIQALLGTAQSDAAIREYVFERWWIAHRTTGFSSELEPYFKVEDILIWRYPGKELRRDFWLNELPPPGKYHPIEESLNNLYLSNSAARYLAVRKILLGEGGVLSDQEGRQGLVDGLMGSWLDYEEGSDAHRVLYNLLSSLMESSAADEIYKFVGPVLQELILRPPQEFSNNDAIALRQGQRVIDSLVERRKLNNPTDADVANVTRKITNLMRGSTTPLEPRTSAADQLLSIFGEREEYEFKHLSPTELALMAGKKAGSLGVRMLQLAGQYYEIPEEERDSYNEVYDSMKGQTRTQAYRVLMREAAHSQDVNELLGEIKSFDERLGGGSLVTVYGVTLKDGGKEVLGIRNPNAEYHVVQLAEVIQRALDLAISRDPDNRDLHLAHSLITDAVTWIRDELNDRNFIAKDTVFRAQNDTRTGNGFKKGNSRYELHVPHAKPTSSMWVRREEFVPGVNLNSLRISDTGPTRLEEKTISRDDYKQAISLLSRNYFWQLSEGDYLHSDIHMGNFRVTEDNSSVAVFDRYNLIPVTPELRTTIRHTMRSIAEGDTAGVLNAIASHAVGDAADVSEVTQRIADSLPASGDPTAAMAQAVLELKKEGINLPINLTLLLRNIFGLSRFAQKAGFDSLLEAFVHTADEAEITRIAGALSEDS